MDVGGTNPYSSAVVSSLGPIHGSFSGAQTDGLSSLQQSAEGLVSSDYLDSFKQGKVCLNWEWLRVQMRTAGSNCQAHHPTSLFFAVSQALHHQQTARTLV